MYWPDISGDCYITPLKRYERYCRRRLLKGPFFFYLRYLVLVIWSGIKFIFTSDPNKAVTCQALRVMRLLERQGAHFTCEGMNQYPASGGPYVFACNHMGTLEVNALPGLVASRIPMTFVVKKKLLRTPFFGRVLRSLKAIPVERQNPGDDLMQVLEVGSKLLAEGISIILFPEGTRQDVFSARRFNSLAMKLAVRAGVSVVPVALRTDFWGVGKWIKEFGPLKTDIPVNIKFGSPIRPTGRGKMEHQQVVNFIFEHLRDWGTSVES